MKYTVPCTHANKDCFAVQKGMCRLLKDTNFRNKLCPFYASKAQAKEQRWNAHQRLKRIGAFDLIEKYGGGEVTWG